MATYKVTARSGLRVRSKPNGTILTAMPYATTVSGDGKKQSGWYHVKYKGRWGWSYGQYLKTVAEKKKTVASIAAKKKPAKKPKTKKANSKKKTDTKKKTDESKNRAKAKGTLGCWGTDLIFEVNSKKILTAKDIKVSQDSRWTKHNILQNVPRGEFSGPDGRHSYHHAICRAWREAKKHGREDPESQPERTGGIPGRWRQNHGLQ